MYQENNNNIGNLKKKKKEEKIFKYKIMPTFSFFSSFYCHP